MPLPPRTPDTMIDAIALSSPSGRMSKRARKSAEERLRKGLFGNDCNLKGKGSVTSEAERLRRHAKTLRELADRGMSPRKFRREADRAEQRAHEKGMDR